MGTCDNCGNHYVRTFEIRWGTEVHEFDSFECAIHVLAPTCDHCGTPIVGHGLESDNRMYCCAHCARQQGTTVLRDRA
jgi:hypothetical protein